MMTTGIRGSEEQGATFVELFFDLVFVFAVTQVAGALAHDLTLPGLAQAVLVFWLVWWAWTQFTWSLNEADTEHVTVRVITLVSTAVAFVMAVSLPHLLETAGWLFPLSYLILRVTGIRLQWHLAAGEPERVRAVRSWTIGSSLGLGAVLAAALSPPEWRLAALGVTALLDVVAALRAGRNEWHLYPGHFSERHGLFVIIALGESLIAAGVGAGVIGLDGDVVVVTVTAVVAACGLWWSYFGWVKDALEEGMARRPIADIGRYARDVYSFAHFPLIFGVIGFAVAVEHGVSHPKDPFDAAVLAALVAGGGLILGGTALSLRFAGIPVPPIRLLTIAVLAASWPVLRATEAWIGLALFAALVLTMATVERPRELSAPAPGTGG